LDRPREALRLRRAHHKRAPTSSTYAALKDAALGLDMWESERDPARAALRDRDTRGYVVALLADGDDELAWRTAVAAPDDTVDTELWLNLAERRQATHPGDALEVLTA